MNNNNNKQHPGLHDGSPGTQYSHPAMANEGVPIMSRNPMIDEAEVRILKDAQPAVEGAPQPAINTNSNIPSINYGTGQYDQRSGGYIPHIPDGGTILSDTTYTYGTRGVVEHNNMSTNTTDQWERQTRAAQYAATQGNSRYNTPVTQTPSVAPNIEEPPKPTQEHLAQLRKRDRLVNINSKLKTLLHERKVASLKLASIDRNIQSLQEQLEEVK
ncbi:MAG: hypothetical protein AAGE84_14065 [Cyanobacteria bacterium P01_G01_bin.39]